MIEVIDLRQGAHLADVVSEVEVSVLLPRVRTVGIPSLDSSLEIIDPKGYPSGKIVPVIRAISCGQSSSQVLTGVDIAEVI
jgi:hypothetical protein